MPPSEWCLEDRHEEYQRDPGFNAWLDSGDDDALVVLDQLGLSSILSPSKALFAGDSLTYEQERNRFRAKRRSRALGEGVLSEHWVGRNRARFGQLLEPLRAGHVVAFVGAGVSCSSDFPSWAKHLLNQAKTAGFSEVDTIDAIRAGKHEEVIQRIVLERGDEVFLQELRDEFLRSAAELSLVRSILGLSSDLVVTTNYDCSVEEAVVEMEGAEFTTLVGPLSSNQSLVAVLSNHRRSVLKVHGTITDPASCVLTRNHYDAVYGETLDLSLPLPRKLRLIYEQRTLLFIGCSLAHDRPLSVFKKVREEAGPENVPQHFALVEAPMDESELPARNQFLLELGITPIWYANGRHELVPALIDELLGEVGC